MAKTTGFEVYQKYLALKLHFNSEKYDYIKYNGKVGKNLSFENFSNRRDRFFYEKLAKLHGEEIESFIISNFITRNIGQEIGWVKDLLTPEAEENFLKWKKKMESFEYIFTEDVKNLFQFTQDSLNVDIGRIFESDGIHGQHSPVFKLYLYKKVNLETLLVLEDIKDLYIEFQVGDLIGDAAIKLMQKYKPFLKFDRAKYSQIFDYIQSSYDLTRTGIC